MFETVVLSQMVLYKELEMLKSHFLGEVENGQN